MSKFFSVLLAAIISTFSYGAHAAPVVGQSDSLTTLQERDLDSDGVTDAFYDSLFDITWLRDANYAKTSGYDLDGRMYWTDANTWATNLVFGGFDDWRLPTTAEEVKGYNHIGSEMSHLWYTELNNTANVYITNKGGFQNLQVNYPSVYWSSTVYEPNPYGRWSFDMAFGKQDANCQGCEYFSMLVRDGDVVAAVPEPESLALVGLALAGLGLTRRKAKQV